MAEPLREEGEVLPRPPPRTLTVARIVKAIAHLHEKGGSTLSAIGKYLESQCGYRTSNNDLKKMLIKAVKAGRVKRANASNRFIIGVGGEGGQYHCRRRRGKGRGRSRRRRRRRKGKKGKKGKKGRKGRRRRRRRGRGKGKGKGKGRKGRRRRRRRRKGGKGKR